MSIRILSKLVSLPVVVLAALLGRFSWRPPVWLQRLGKILAGALSWLGACYAAWAKKSPVAAKLSQVGGILLLACAIGFAAWSYFTPAPERVSYVVNSIAPTPLEKDSKPFPLVVDFSRPVAAMEYVGKDVSSKIKVSPAITGKWMWELDGKLTFTPETDWTVGETYRVDLPKLLFKPHTLLDSNDFRFISPALSLELKSSEFYEDPTDPVKKQAVATIKFTHPVDKSDLEKHVSASLRVLPVKSFSERGAQSMQFVVVYNEEATEAYVRTSDIRIPEREGEVQIKVTSGVHAAKGGVGSASQVEAKVSIPSIENYFKISRVSEEIVTDKKTDEASRVLVIETTASLTQDELARNTEAFLLPNDPATVKEARALMEAQKEREAAVSEEESDDSAGGEDSEGKEGGEGEETEEVSADLSTVQCPWPSAGSVSDRILARATKLPLNWTPTQQPNQAVFTAKYATTEGRCVFVRVKKGTRSFGDYRLMSDRVFLVGTQGFPVEARILHEGSLLAVSGDKKLSVMGRGTSTLRMTLSRVLPNSVHHLVSQSDWGSTFTKPDFSNMFSLDNMSEVYSSYVDLPQVAPGRPSYGFFDFGSYVSSGPSVPRGLFVLQTIAWDKARKTSLGEYDKRLVILTDMALVVKDLQDETHEVFVASISGEGPVAGAKVELLGRNGIPVFSAETDADGHVKLPNLKGLLREKYPTVYVATKGDDYTFMPFDKWGRQLNYSRFDTGGLYTDRSAQSLQAFLFSDRGIYRPGETAHLGVVVKSVDWKPLAAGTPLEISISDPRAKVIRQEPLKFGVAGFEEYAVDFSDTALSGSYQVSLFLVQPKKQIRTLLGSTQVRVEEFVPDRLRVKAALSAKTQKGWLSPEGLKSSVMVENMFGTKAVGNRVKLSMRLSPQLPAFVGFADYLFFDPLHTKTTINEVVGEKETNFDGLVEFELNLARFDKGTYRLSLLAEGFEKESGRAVASDVNAIVSPLPFLVGFKTDGDRSFIKKGVSRKVEFIALSPELTKVAVSGLSLELVETSYISVLTKLESGSLAYQSVEKKETIRSSPMSIAEGGEFVPLATEKPGSFCYVVKNAEGAILSKVDYVVSGEGNVTRDLERNAELRTKLSKTDYAPGEDIEIQITAPYTGYGLITIERDKIYAHSWFKADTTSSIQRIRVPEQMEGNAYVSVAFVRSLTSREIYTSPLSIGVEPFSVSRERRTLKVSIEAPALVEPGTKLEVSYHLTTPGRVVVYGVDEGILQVARYKTPEPLSYFFRKRALEIQTKQILDLILPEYSLVKELSGTGGDEDAFLAKHYNPFKRKGQKPMVFWSGIRDSEAVDGKVSVDVPDYFNGTVKLFAVAVSGDAIGVAEGKTLVQGALVLTPNAPYVVSPADEFEVSTGLSNIRSAASSITLSLISSDEFELLSPSEQKLELPKGEDKALTYRVRTKTKLGAGTLTFKASSSDASAKYAVSISIRPASPRFTTIDYGVVAGGGSQATLEAKRKLYLEESVRQVHLSSSPLAFMQGMARYLEDYPHGCSEQVTSQALPLLVLANWPEAGVMKERAQRAFDRVAALLSSRQRENGSIRTWPGLDESNDWITLHVARFVLEGRERGFEPSRSFEGEIFQYVRVLANSAGSTLEEIRNRAYATYLLTRKGEVTSNYVQAIREDLKKGEIQGWQSDIAAMYLAASMKLMRQDKEADALMRGVPYKPVKEMDFGIHSSLSHTAHYLSMVSRHFPEALKTMPKEVLQELGQKLTARKYETISAAVLILALDDYATATGKAELGAVELELSADGKAFSDTSIVTAVNELKPSDQYLKLKNSSAKSLFYGLIQSGFDMDSFAVQGSSGMEVFREYMNQKGEVVTAAELGKELEVSILLRGEARGEDFGEVAVTDMLPACFEIIGGTLGLSGASGNLKVEEAWSPRFFEAREDRVLLYGYLPEGARRFNYRVRATSRGKFVTPLVQADAMYNSALYARGGVGTFEVK